MDVQHCFAIDERVKDKLEKMADDGHRTLAAQIRMALEEYLEKQK